MSALLHALRGAVSRPTLAHSHTGLRLFATESDKTVYLVFGGTGGVGAALVQRLAQQPGSVVVAASDEGGRHEDVKDAENVHGCSCDVLDSRAVSSAVEDTVKRHGSLYGVANCVGTINSKPTHLLEDDEFMHHLRLNAFSAFATIKGSVKALMQNGGGSIALVGAAVAHKGTANHDAIAAAKGAVAALSRGAASTYAAHGIRINTVVPSLVDSPLAEGMMRNEAARDTSERMHALRGVARPEDVAAALEFVLRPSNRFVTGSEVFVDGGLSHLAPTTAAAPR